MQLVGVLKLIDQDMAKAPLVVGADVGMVAQHLIAAQHQLAKIDHAFALALFFVELVNLHLALCVGVARFHRCGAQAIFLATGNEPDQLLGRKALFVRANLLAQALDRAELVLRVQNLEGLRQIGGLEVRAQKAVAQAMKGANPHAPCVDGQHRGQADDHFFGRLVGKRNRQYAALRHIAVLQQPSDARGQHPCFARTGTGQYQRVLGRQGDGGALLGVERAEHG